MKLSPEMIEAAARAIREHVAGRSTFTGFRKPRPWESLPLTLRDDYRAEAIEAGGGFIDLGGDKRCERR